MNRPDPTLVALFLLAAPLLAQPTALSVNISSREEVRQFYRGVYSASEDVPMNWTGSYATGTAGDTSPAYKEATRLRINFFRALAGVPAGITFNATYSAKNQQSALMVSANNTLDHFPPPSWIFYTAAGADGAANSNLGIGYSGPDAITGYISDEGPNNAAVGHRRWLFYPQTLQMGTGDVPGDGTRQAANTVWILDTTPGGQFGATRPATRTTQITYPPAGFVPYQLVWPRWSFSYPAADFSAASVAMTRNGQNVAVAPELLIAGTEGEPTLIWVYDGLNSNSAAPHARPATDTTYSVNVNNVRIGGVARNFSYNVTVFDPDVPGADFSPMAVSSAASPAPGVATTYSVTRPSFASAFEWRTLQLSPFTKSFTAESGLEGLVATTSTGYDVVQSFVAGAGSSAYNLAHVSQNSSQVLQLPGSFYVMDASAAITFLSQLGIATAIEVAHVQVSTDEGSTWRELFTQTGTSPTNTSTPAPTDIAFVARSIPLSAYVGRTLNVRFVYSNDIQGTFFLPVPNSNVGWFIDNLTLTSVQTVTAAASAATRVASGATFAYTPAAAGPFALQARGVLFGAYPIEWGPIAQFTAIDPTANNNPGRLINLSILTALSTAGDSFTMGYVVGGPGTAGIKPLVIRAAGPSLGALGVPGTLDDPKLELFASSTKTGENDNWGGSAQLAAAMAGVGAFAYTGPTSRDAAALASIATSDNSVKVSAAGTGTGAVIAEIYDATPTASFSASTPRLVNVSVLKNIGSGLTAGFVIGGGSAKTVLVRAIGPTLGAAPFNVPGVVADPQLTLFSGQTIIGTNDNWGGTTALTVAFAQVGAFVLPATSRDAALVATLAPGNYTVQVSGVGGTTGVALVEVYEVP